MFSPRSRALLAAIALISCSVSCTTARPAHGTPRSTITSGARTSPTPAAGRACPASRTFASLPSFGRDAGAPDDMFALGDGSLWVTDPSAGRITHLDTSGRVLQRITDANTPEGIVAVGEELLVAEQLHNRIVAISPSSGERRVVVQLPEVAGRSGLDGIALGASGTHILIPDSPSGTLSSMPLAGGTRSVIARGLGRVVDAVLTDRGHIFATVEGPAGLFRIEHDRAVPIPGIGRADDVVAAGGTLYVSLIAAGEVIALDLENGMRHVLVTRGGTIQGLAVLPGARLAIASGGRIAVTATCSG